MHLEDHNGWGNSLELIVCLGVNLHGGQGHIHELLGLKSSTLDH